MHSFSRLQSHSQKQRLTQIRGAGSNGEQPHIVLFPLQSVLDVHSLWQVHTPAGPGPPQPQRYPVGHAGPSSVHALPSAPPAPPAPPPAPAAPPAAPPPASPAAPPLWPATAPPPPAWPPLPPLPALPIPPSPAFDRMDPQDDDRTVATTSATSSLRIMPEGDSNKGARRRSGAPAAIPKQAPAPRQFPDTPAVRTA
jgi:hypothetical protein